MSVGAKTGGVLDWREAFEEGPEVCGGKGFQLARLERFGFRVPRGGVLPACWYAEVVALLPAEPLRTVGAASAEDALDPAIVAALEEICRAIEAVTLPPAMEAALAAFLQGGFEQSSVAVRSSATTEDSARASFAGIHRSLLNQRGNAQIARAIRGCYASLWTPQALAYRRRMRFRDDEVQCAVVICEMVHAPGRDEPVAAGVGFTFDPVTGRRDLIVVDAAAAMGEAVVGGRVNPYRIVYRCRKTGLLFHARAAGTPPFPADRENELVHVLHRLHWALGEGQDPQDVEWAFDGSRFWIVQARPATSVRRHVPDSVATLPRYWSTANIKDAVPGIVCTMSWSVIQAMVGDVLFAGMIATGYPVPTGAELVRRFKGRAYFDLTLMQWVMYDALGVAPAQMARSVGGHQPEIPVPGDPMKGAAGRRRRGAQLRLMWRLLRIERELKAAIRRQNKMLAEWRNADFASRAPLELASILERFSHEHDSLDIVVGLANAAEGPWEVVLERLLTPLVGQERRPLVGRLLAGTGAVSSAEHGYATLQLAEHARADRTALEWLQSGAPASTWKELPEDSTFKQHLARFLDAYGHRAVYEADLLNPRWAEDPTYILDHVRYAIANPEAASRRQTAQQIRERAESELRRAAGWRSPLMFWVLKRLRLAMAAREAAKSALVASSLPTRRVLLEVGRRFVQAGRLDEPQDILHLSWVDLACWFEGWWDGSGARELARDRARRRNQWLDEAAPPDVIAEDPDGRVTAAVANVPPSAPIWTGIGAASGRARGRARIVTHPNRHAGFAQGDVLVAPSTDPGWTPLFLRASAIVMESGGYLSHGAIVAREYGIPAVVNLPGILNALQNGDDLVVDGDRGQVTRVRPETTRV